jgi:hypothetical protein
MPKRLTLLLLLTALLIPFIINCGKKAPPLPPIIIAPELPSEAHARQSGSMMIFMFEMPVLNTDEETRADIEKIEIYRLKEQRIGAGEAQTQTQPQTQTQTQSQPQTQTQTQSQPQSQTQALVIAQTQTQNLQTQTSQSQPQSQTQTQTQSQSQAQTQSQTTQSAPAKEEEAREIEGAEFKKRSELIAEISRDQIDGYLRDNKFIITEPINVQEGSEDLQNWYYYGAKVYNKRGKSAGYSKFAALFPAVVPKPPANFTAKLSEKQIQLDWTAVTSDINGVSVPQESVRYNIYRGTTANFAPEQPLNSDELDAVTYTDTTFEYGKSYYYFIRAHFYGKKKGQQSAPSNIILIYPQDTFPPKAPEELNVVSAREGMVLIWAPNSEEDVVGYNIYRTTITGQDYTKINQAVIRETTFTDKDIQLGQRYYYVITAVDSAPVPNESEKSAETTEVARKQ